MPDQSLFSDLIKMLQRVHKPEDISPELINELKGLSTLLTFRFFLAHRDDGNSLHALEDTRATFNEYFDLILKDIVSGKADYQMPN